MLAQKKKEESMKNKWIGVVIGLWFFTLLLPGAFAKEAVTVYTCLETDEIVELPDVARKDLPDLEINIFDSRRVTFSTRCWREG